MNNILLKFHTAKHYKIQQIIRRLEKMIKRRLFSKRKMRKKITRRYEKCYIASSSSLIENFDLNSNLSKKDFYVGLVYEVQKILEGKFSFLNMTKEFPVNVTWETDFSSKLWGYNLNYFNYLMPLSIVCRAERDDICFNKIKDLISNWYFSYDFQNETCSAPYVVSLRLVNVIWMLRILEKRVFDNEEFRDMILEYLYCDLIYLSKNLELDILGNHLIKNLKALIIVGYFLNTKECIKIAKHAEKKLLEQLKVQILSDGGHFERSPMYHVVVTQDLLEIIYFRRLFSISENQGIVRIAMSAIRFAEVITHPDGDIALFNDSAFNIAPKASDILFFGCKLLNLPLSRYAQPGLISYLCLPVSSNDEDDLIIKDHEYNVIPMTSTGYYKLSNVHGTMILDCGDLGPDYLPAHSHNDMLSYELSIGTKRYITDTGVYEYEEGEKRATSRKTESHNTVVVNDGEQSEIWSSFRMGRRGRILSSKLKSYHDYSVIKASHSGFKRYKSKALHTRIIISHRDGYWLIIDRIDGKKKTHNESYLHLGPGLNADFFSDGQIEVGSLFIVPIAGKKSDLVVTVLDTEYFPEFGKILKRRSIRISTDEAVFGYFLLPFPMKQFNCCLDHARLMVTGSINEKSFAFDI